MNPARLDLGGNNRVVLTRVGRSWGQQRSAWGWHFLHGDDRIPPVPT